MYPNRLLILFIIFLFLTEWFVAENLNKEIVFELKATEMLPQYVYEPMIIRGIIKDVFNSPVAGQCKFFFLC